MSLNHRSILIIGGDGEFGSFLRHDILPSFDISDVRVAERGTSREDLSQLVASVRHVVLATPLAGYAELACELVYRCRGVNTPLTLWLIPSVQAGVWRAVSATLELVANPFLSAVFVHPMYGPNGFRETEPEARTFQNILTATHVGVGHPLEGEVDTLTRSFVAHFNISTTTSFGPDEHDRFTAYSQGLSYCVARLMFTNPAIDQILGERLPDLHRSFTANHDLILDFLRINSFMPQVIAAFEDTWRQTGQSAYHDVVNAFGCADAALNRQADSPISTKWYERLRRAATQ